MCSGSEAGSYLRIIDFVYHSTLGLRVIKKTRRRRRGDPKFPVVYQHCQLWAWVEQIFFVY